MTSAFVSSPIASLSTEKKSIRRARRPVCSCAGTNLTRRAALGYLAGTAAALLSLSFSRGADNAFAQEQVSSADRKVTGGSASTGGGGSSDLKSVVKTVTRGVNLEGADFSGRSFEGVSFQQSMLRGSNFSRCQLRDASFFDADLAGVDFSNADLRGVNFELANLRNANLTNADLSGAYISSTTKMDGVKIGSSDWSDTLLRKDQRNFLCNIAEGTHPDTGIETKASLMCPE